MFITYINYAVYKYNLFVTSLRYVKKKITSYYIIKLTKGYFATVCAYEFIISFCCDQCTNFSPKIIIYETYLSVFSRQLINAR